LQGLALVFAVLWLFFGLRFAFWVTAGLPVAFMGGLAIMAAFGYSLNLMTTIGLLIVIGLLMDDAIVISENIARHREKGADRLDAAIRGARQVFPNVLASFATTAMIFGSLAFLIRAPSPKRAASTRPGGIRLDPSARLVTKPATTAAVRRPRRDTVRSRIMPRALRVCARARSAPARR
jgi:hypothetical protein